MPFIVIVCERSTGVVCHSDGRRRLTTGGPPQDLAFASLAVAEAWCQELRSRRPDLECWVGDELGQQVSVFR
jgi:hypothetical protein